MNAQALLHRVADQYRRILGENLTGLYVHGSIAFGCFTPETGDIDFLAVVRRALTQAEKEALIRVLLDLTPLAPPKGFEMSVVTEAAVKPFQYPTPFETHFSNAHRVRAEADLTAYCREMQGTDPDLAAHITVLHHTGVTLWGAPIPSVFAPVPRACYADSIMQDITGAEAAIADDPVYVTLNLCRVLAALTENAVLSKEQGGRWGLQHLPEHHHPLLRAALAAYRGERPFPGGLPLQPFAGELLAHIRAAADPECKHWP